jgi:heptosyltransferase-2
MILNTDFWHLNTALAEPDEVGSASASPNMSPRAPRILVFRGGAIGDFVVTLPVLQALRQRWPDAYVELVGYPRVAELARLGGLVDKVTSLDAAHVSRWFSLQPNVTSEQVEHIRSFDITLTYLYDPEAIVRRNLRNAGARQVLYGAPLVRDAHACEYLFRPLNDLAIAPESPLIPRLRLPDAHVAAGRQRIGSSPHPVLALHPGSGSARKNWPLERFLALADRVGAAASLAPRFIVGEADESLRERLLADGRGASLIAGLSLVELAGVLAGCAAFAGNDSGISHLAAALGVPAVAIYGPTDPSVWGVRGDRACCVSDATHGDAPWASLPVEAVESALHAIRAVR